MSTRLIVKNLPPSADEKRLRTHFGSEGDITDVKVLRNKYGTGRVHEMHRTQFDEKYISCLLFRCGSSRGFAFIGFKNEAQAEHARKYFDRSCLGSCKLSVSAAEAYKPSQEAKRVLHKTPVHTTATQSRPSEQDHKVLFSLHDYDVEKIWMQL